MATKYCMAKIEISLLNRKKNYNNNIINNTNSN